MADINIKALRKRLGWTQAMLGKEVGVKQCTIARWEGGTKPRGPAMKMLKLLHAAHPSPSRRKCNGRQR